MLAELRGDECLYYVRNAASGHPGSITSCHAGSPALAFEQLAIMIQDSPGGANLTFDVIKRLLGLTIDVVVQFQNHLGERFMDLNNARTVIYTCSRSSIKEGGVTTLGQSLTRCEIQATPCRAPRSKPLAPPEDRDEPR